MVGLGSFTATRSLAKARLQRALTSVADFYYGVFTATGFSQLRSQRVRLEDYIANNLFLAGQGRLLPQTSIQVLQYSRTEVPKICVLLLLSYLEPYLKDVCVSAILSKPGLLLAVPTSVGGDSIAANPAICESFADIASHTVDTTWLRGDYTERFRALEKNLGVPKDLIAQDLPVLNEFYAKRNCILHNNGKIDAKAKRSLPNDALNVIDGEVVIDESEYFRLHSTINRVAKRVDRFIMSEHIGNLEALRLIYALHFEHPDWPAKRITEAGLQKGLDMISRNVVSHILQIREC